MSIYYWDLTKICIFLKLNKSSDQKLIIARNEPFICGKGFMKGNFSLFLCQRPYHVEYTSSRPITEVKHMGVARGKSGWGSFPKGRRPRAGCGAEPHVAPQAKIFWVLDGGGIPRI